MMCDSDYIMTNLCSSVIDYYNTYVYIYIINRKLNRYECYIFCIKCSEIEEVYIDWLVWFAQTLFSIISNFQCWFSPICLLATRSVHCYHTSHRVNTSFFQLLLLSPSSPSSVTQYCIVDMSPGDNDVFYVLSHNFQIKVNNNNSNKLYTIIAA